VVQGTPRLPSPRVRCTPPPSPSTGPRASQEAIDLPPPPCWHASQPGEGDRSPDEQSGPNDLDSLIACRRGAYHSVEPPGEDVHTAMPLTTVNSGKSRSSTVQASGTNGWVEKRTRWHLTGFQAAHAGSIPVVRHPRPRPLPLWALRAVTAPNRRKLRYQKQPGVREPPPSSPRLNPSSPLRPTLRHRA
jgi:hypothetical protein